MISFKTVLKKKKLSTGKYPIYLRITKERKSVFFRTPYTCLEKEWNKKQGKFNKNAPDYLKRNRILLKFIDRATDVVTDLEQKKGFYTLTDIESVMRIQSNPVYKNIFAFWEEIIADMIQAGKIGNARVNLDTLKSIKNFSQNRSLTFEQITPVFLEKYEVSLRANGGTDGGISVRMRTLRALFNSAIKREIIKQEIYPFTKYKVSKLKGKGIKKALALEDVQKIIKKDLSTYPKLVNARNYFVFSFYTRGMNFADMIKLRWKDVIDDQIYYTRSKTKTNFRIKTLPPVEEILDYYRNRKNGTDYVFPILLKNELTPSQIENRKKKTLKQFNKDLKEIAALCEINKSVSSYVARHSYANCLKQKGIATDIISESMGHQNIAITQAYLKELDNSLVDEAMEVLL
ncbi:site-specific integrase [Maribellus maritimus]|uniref:site-specific integrase n=1 Tax=Maribellus maritimus TaxID=2870838 RepID=UPI001EEA9044|nr:site-specific integrase [Maribellus maritimus]MCG6191090.1 site-specific integrase [Maribellus maritimus]